MSRQIAFTPGGISLRNNNEMAASQKQGRIAKMRRRIIALEKSLDDGTANSKLGAYHELRQLRKAITTAKNTEIDWGY